MAKVRMAQFGTKHGHAEGKLRAMLSNPRVEVAGVYEPDSSRRRELEARGGVWAEVRWFDSPDDLLSDPSIVAVASEGRNDESLAHTEQIVQAGKHVWYDKPAGDDWPRWQRVVDRARAEGLYIQMGYMFRYHHGFRLITEWARSGALGQVFAVRAHMSTRISEEQKRAIAVHRGGIFYDLAGHMIDQIVWMLGRPERVSSFLREDLKDVPGFRDNTLGVLEYPSALAFVDISAMEPRPMARRFEVYGTVGSAIMEPFEPPRAVRLCLEQPSAGHPAGEHFLQVEFTSRQALYEAELEAFLGVIAEGREPDRTPEHELLVQETLLRLTGDI